MKTKVLQVRLSAVNRELVICWSKLTGRSETEVANLIVAAVREQLSGDAEAVANLGRRLAVLREMEDERQMSAGRVSVLQRKLKGI